MFKRVLSIPVLIIAVVLLFLLTACGSSETPKDSQGPAIATSSSSATSEASKPATSPVEVKKSSLRGNYEAAGSTTESGMVATVTANQIVIFWTSPGSRSLFWQGTFNSNATEGTQISKGDAEEMSSALLASTETEKPFTVKDGKISCEVSAMGTSTIVIFEKVK